MPLQPIKFWIGPPQGVSTPSSGIGVMAIGTTFQVG